MAHNVDSPGLREQFSELRLPLALVDLDEMTILALTPSALSPGGPVASDVIGHPVLDVVPPADRARAALALDALASGSVDFAWMHGRLLIGPDAATIRTMWAATVELAGERVAFVQIAAGPPPRASPLERALGTSPLDLTLGTVDRKWTITTISSGVERLLGVTADAMTGTNLLGALEQGEVGQVLGALAAAKTGLCVGLTVRMRRIEGWADVQMVLGTLAGSAEHLFILAPPALGPDLQALKLEQHLRRIAAEVQASGVLETAAAVPALASVADRGTLTPRQWEVLGRLLRGERVQTIAKELYVSESTVRNHLSAIYTRLGVRSQAELMALALGPDGSSA